MRGGKERKGKKVPPHVARGLVQLNPKAFLLWAVSRWVRARWGTELVAGARGASIGRH